MHRRASRLPMRNWNKLFQCCRMSSRRASRLPMRNWNKTHVTTQKFTKSFQTTYEELKPRSRAGTISGNSSLPDYLWGIETLPPRTVCCHHRCFQTTYEELKPVWNWRFPEPDPGFQTTYEELKLPGDNDFSYLVWLPDYLWGIETMPLHTVTDWRWWLPDYLWGIETKVR